MSRLKAIIFMILAAILWSSGGLLIKYVDWNPMAIAGTRSGISAIIMLLYLRKPIKLKKHKMAGASCYCAMVILFVIANKLTTAANAILLQYTAPIWVALLSVWILKEKILKIDWMAIFVVFIGMALFFLDELQGGQIIGNILSVIGGICLAGVVISLKFSKDDIAVEIPLLGNLLTFLICLPFVIGPMPSSKSIIALIILGIFQLGISYILFTEGIKHVSAIEAILIAVIEPLLNPIWVFVFTKETPGIFAILGGIIVVCAVTVRSLIVNNQEKEKMLEQKII